jgi:hypothetical protein
MRTAIALSLFALALAIHGCKPADNSTTATNPPENSAVTNSVSGNVSNNPSKPPEANVKVNPAPIVNEKSDAHNTSIVFYMDDVKPYFALLPKVISGADPTDASDIASRISELKVGESMKAELKGANEVLRISAEVKDDRKFPTLRFVSTSADLIDRVKKTVYKLPQNN